MSIHDDCIHNELVRNRFAKNQPIRTQCSMLALGAMLAASLMMPAFAQSVDIDADGNVTVDGGDGTVIEAGTAGTEVRTYGATVEAGSQQNLSSHSGYYRTDGDNVQIESDGGVHVISAGGGRATTTVNGQTTSSSSSASASDGGVSYANQDLRGNDFAGMRLEGATFANSALQGASFRDASLVGASFANADLDSVDFRGANLQNATLTNAALSGARFEGAIWIDGRVCGSGSVGGCR